jgi:multiple sugar transport system substrate-binding protein
MDYRHLARVVFNAVKEKSDKPVLVKPKGFYQVPAPGPHIRKELELSLLTVISPTAEILVTLNPCLKHHTGINLKVVALHYDELSQLLASGRAQAFDLIRIDTSWSARFERELFYTLGDWTHKIESLAGAFLPSINKIFMNDMQNLYSLPFDPSIQMLFYRKDLFENATIKRLFYEKTKEKLEVPKNYKEYNRIAAFFNSALNEKSPIRYGTTMVFGTASVAACEVLPRVKDMGGDIFDKSGNICINTPAFKKALEEYLEMKSYSSPDINYWWGDALESFSSGLSAMTIIFINQVSGIIRTSGQGVPMSVGAVPIPGNYPLLGGGTIGISRHSKNIDRCIDFFNWVYSDEIANMITLLGGLSPCKSVFNNEEILAVYPWLRNMDGHYNRGWRRISSKRYPYFDTHQFEQIFGNAVRNAALGINTPEDALKNAQLQCEMEFKV